MSADADVSYLWYPAPTPAGLEITQVYGYLLCPHTGRVLIIDDDGVFNLPGGRPEPYDEDMVATLKREAMEEAQVRVAQTAYLGYQEVRRAGRAPYAQVRMVGVISAFGPRRPDVDNGRTYRRLLAPLMHAPGVLGWGRPAVAQATLAGEIARTIWKLPVGTPAPPGYVD
ncbi:NUDIX hydrolase [Bailinhaonella thermotolerans]|uniref:NUDIX hydrolase n=1 Tax=Bailinhaonella thermotolerans TaxID=1070861 RepID=A0A3A4AAU7_9ACTN|nr:NUDIX domain-containing protein [Bailinhaonella thermotolerans]RJL23957.1 NUDIX hydrolase [Bailinhaonella thermotolerans]